MKSKLLLLAMLLIVSCTTTTIENEVFYPDSEVELIQSKINYSPGDSIDIVVRHRMLNDDVDSVALVFTVAAGPLGYELIEETDDCVEIGRKYFMSNYNILSVENINNNVYKIIIDPDFEENNYYHIRGVAAPGNYSGYFNFTVTSGLVDGEVNFTNNIGNAKFIIN